MNATVFHQAVADGDATRVKFLINIGQQARVNQPNKKGYTALQQSCKDGRLDVVHVLLNHGADMNTKGRKGRTALHLAAASGHSDIVTFLIKSCADLTVKDGAGNLPQDLAKTEEIGKLLCAAQAERNAKSSHVGKKSNSEEWSQNFKSLPAGSRNSVVSNSSSDSGVYMSEEVSSCRSTDSRLSAPRNGARGAMEVLNELDEVHERSSFSGFSHTTVRPQPKLRRSMSERLPSGSRRARRSVGGRRNISEELSALNLARANARQGGGGAPEPEVHAKQPHNENEPKDVDSNDPGYTSVDSPNDDLDVCAVVQGVESGRASTRKYPTYEERSLAKNVGETVVYYAGGDEGCEVDELDEGTIASALQGIPEHPARRKVCDDIDLYRRSQPRNLRSSRRRTVEIGDISHENERQHPVARDTDYQEHYNDSKQYIASRRHGSFRGDHRAVACDRDSNQDMRDTPRDIRSRNYEMDNNNTITRTMSARSETEMKQSYRNRVHHEETKGFKQLPHYPTDCYSENNDYCESPNVYRDPCNNIPAYEETLSRSKCYSSERARRPTSRQVSEV